MSNRNDYQPNLFATDAYGEVTPAHQRHSETSREAAETIAPSLNELQRLVLLAFQSEAAGLTDEQGIDVTALPASTYRPRRVELLRAGLIRDSGTKRKVRSGCNATVWVLA
jgi:hypothetical protein